MRHPTLTDPPAILHGGDYNPDQWLDRPDILAEDIRLMGLAGVSTVSLGIFAWAALEPERDRFEFGWMDDCIGRLHQAGISVFLATPSGGKPNWLALAHEEVRRVDAEGRREPQRRRHNHCYTSPIYRERVALISGKLAERYGSHPAVRMWHLSNEYRGECHCPLCWDAFRTWLRQRYDDDITRLNDAWWSRFWSHTFTSFDQITTIDAAVHGLELDWRRFVTHQTRDFIRHEIASVRTRSELPTCTNLMGFFKPLDYQRLAEDIDVVSHDDYPAWHKHGDDAAVACGSSLAFDLMRSLKRGKPWLLMESTPSQVNWQDVSVPKRPGVHRAHALLAVAHGSDAVCYFQWRKGRGSSEKFHGAVVDHVGHERTRVFREVAELGSELAQLGDLAGAGVAAEAAVIADWESRWALEASQLPRNADLDLMGTIHHHYAPLWRRGIPCDIIAGHDPLDGYRLVLAPMLYLLKPGAAERMRTFVEGGGVLLLTYHSAIADEHDLVFAGGWPGGGLRDLFGIWVEEQDVLVEHLEQQLCYADGNPLDISGERRVIHHADVIHAEGAQVAATWGDQFYAGGPALTVNRIGQGEAWYCGGRLDAGGVDELVAGLLERAGIEPEIPDLPDGVHVARRGDHLFVFNFAGQPRGVILPDGCRGALSGAELTDLDLAGYDARVLRRDAPR